MSAYLDTIYLHISRLWFSGPTPSWERTMTQPSALIPQPNEEKIHLFLAADLKPLHDSNVNQGLFLPLSPAICRKLPTPRQGFSEGNWVFSLFQEGFVGYSHGVEEVSSSLAALEGLQGKKTKLSWLLERKKANFSSSKSCPFLRTHLQFPLISHFWCL